VFARSGEGPGAKGLSAFVVDADAPGLSVAERIHVIAPHPLATLKFNACRVAVTNRLGAPITKTRLPRRYASGLHDYAGVPIHVSAGVGMERGAAPQLRFLCPPEISLLEVTY